MMHGTLTYLSRSDGAVRIRFDGLFEEFFLARTLHHNYLYTKGATSKGVLIHIRTIIQKQVKNKTIILPRVRGGGGLLELCTNTEEHKNAK